MLMVPSFGLVKATVASGDYLLTDVMLRDEDDYVIFGGSCLYNGRVGLGNAAAGGC